jgi:hypothetical protein
MEDNRLKVLVNANHPVFRAAPSTWGPISFFRRSFPCVLLLLTLGCRDNPGEKNIVSSKYVILQEECEPEPNESFDTSVRFNNEMFRLKCVTECSKDFPLRDTLHDSIIRLYHDRSLKFHLAGPGTDTQFVFSREDIKNVKGYKLGYENSTIALIGIDSIDTARNTFVIRVAHLYPDGLGGTDFFDDIYLDINLKGRISVRRIVPYTEPGME